MLLNSNMVIFLEELEKMLEYPKVTPLKS